MLKTVVSPAGLCSYIVTSPAARSTFDAMRAFFKDMNEFSADADFFMSTEEDTLLDIYPRHVSRFLI